MCIVHTYTHHNTCSHCGTWNWTLSYCNRHFFRNPFSYTGLQRPSLCSIPATRGLMHRDIDFGLSLNVDAALE